MSTTPPPRRAILTHGIAFFLLAGGAYGQAVWNGSASQSWDTPANWSGGAKPTAADEASFPTPVAGSGPVILSTGEVANDLSFADAYTLSGGDLTLTTGAITVATGKSASVGSPLLGSAGLSVGGGGTLVLTGTNLYSGATALAAGTLALSGGDNRLPTATTLSFTGNSTLDLGGNAQTVAGASVGSGVTATLANGPLSLGAGTLSFLGGTASTSTFAGALAIAGGATIDASAAGGTAVATGVVRTVSANISGTGGLTLNVFGNVADNGGSNSALFSLTGTNTFTGGVTISGGLVRAASDAAFGDAANQIDITGGGLLASANLTLGASRSIVLDGTGDRYVRVYDSGATVALTINGVISGAGNLHKTDGGKLVLAGANTYTGSTIVTGGGNSALYLSADANLGTAPATATPADLVVNGAVLGITNTLTLNANRGLALGPATGSGAGTILVAPGQTASYAGIMANNGGTGGLTKTGTGTLVLGGGNTYTGGTTLTTGALTLDFGNAAAPASNIINGASALVTTTGTLNLLGGSAAANSQTFASFALSNGGTSVVLTPNATPQPLLLALGLITRGGGGQVDFTLPTGTPGTANGITTSSPNNAAGILGPWATVGGTDWATVSSGNIVALSSYTALPLTGGSTTTNYLLSNAIATNTLTGAVTINSLKIANGASSQVLALAANALTLSTTGGLIYAGGSDNKYSITGTGILGAGAANPFFIAAKQGTLTISAPIIGSGAGGFLKDGDGTVVLSGTSTFTGASYINGGTVQATAVAALGATTTTVTIDPDATLWLNVASAVTHANVINGGGTLKVTSGGGTSSSTVLSGNLGGLTGLLDIAPATTGGGKVNLSNTTQANTPPAAATIKVESGGTLYLNAALNYASAFQLSGGATGEALGNLRVENATVTGPITLLASSTVGANSGTGTISGSIGESGGSFGLTKLGAGLTVLSGTNTYTGVTSIGLGTLRLGSATAFPAGGSLAFSNATSSATLDVQGNALTVGSLTFGTQTSGTATVTGTAASSLTTSAATLAFQPVNTAGDLTVDLSALGAFTYNNAAGTFKADGNTGVAVTGTHGVTVTLSALSNSITAANFALAGAGASSGIPFTTLNLGRTNVLDANTILIANSVSRASGTLQFGAAVTGTKTLTIRGAGGGSTTANLTLGAGNSFASGDTDLATFDSTAGSLDALFGSINLARANTSGSGRGVTVTANFKMGAGTLSANTLVLGSVDGSGTGSTEIANATLDLSAGAVVNIGTVTMATNSLATGNTITVNSQLNLSGGATLNATTIQQGTITNIGTLTTRINWNDGLIGNRAGGGLSVAGVTIALAGAAANHTFQISAGQSGSVGALISGTGPLTKAGVGALTLSAANTYAGATSVTGGTLILSGSINGSTAVAVQNSTLQLGANEVLNDTAAVTLDGATFQPNGFSETTGALTLASSATVDLAQLASVVHFADSSASLWGSGALLTVAGWAGNSAGGGSDQLFFGSSASGLGANLASVQFLDPQGFAPGLYGAQQLATGEIVAIPEPAALGSLLAGLGLLAFGRRRRGR